MRRFLPLLIVVVGLAALAVDFLTFRGHFGTDVCSPPTSTAGCIDTRLGPRPSGRPARRISGTTGPGSCRSRADDMATIRTIIENRINQYGVAEPVVQTQGSDRVVVEIPGVIGRRGGAPADRLDRSAAVRADSKDYATAVGQGTHLGTDLPACPTDLTTITTPCVLFNGDQSASAASGIDSTTGQRVGQLHAQGPRRGPLRQVRERRLRRPEQRQQPAVRDRPRRQRRVGAVGQRTALRRHGRRSTATSRTADVTQPRHRPQVRLAAAADQEVSFSQISATLGLNFLQQSILAGAIGIALVFIFMLVHYRLPGVVACVALIFYTLVSFAIFRFIPVTLTLAGVAAFVLSVGMAVDANILIFERTKEELRSGKTLVSAVEAGFNRAWNSIFDSNMSSIITATILFYFGSATIRGFALVLIIGVLLSMFTAVTLSRMMLRWIVRQPWARHARLFGVSEEEFIVAAPRQRAVAAR